MTGRGIYVDASRAIGKPLFSTGSSAWCSVMTYGVRWWGGREVQEGEDLGIHTGDSLCCMAETNNIVKQLYSSFLKMHKPKKIKR